MTKASRLSVKAVKSLLDDLVISCRLSSYDVPKKEIPGLPKATIGAVRLVSNNPRKATERNVIHILEENY